MDHEGDDCDDAFDGAQFALAMLTIALNEEHDDQYYKLRFGDQASTHDTATPFGIHQVSPLSYGDNDANLDDEDNDEDEVYGKWFAESMLMVIDIEEHDDMYYDGMFGDHATASRPTTPVVDL